MSNILSPVKPSPCTFPFSKTALGQDPQLLFQLSIIPSRIQALYFIVLLMATATACCYLPLWVVLIAVPVCLVLLAKHLWQCDRAHGDLRFLGDYWQWQSNENEGLELDLLLHQATVWQWLMVLNFTEQPSGKVCTLVLWPDSSDADSLRRLRVVLRHYSVLAGTSRIRAFSKTGFYPKDS